MADPPDFTSREIWGYAVWLFVGLVFGVPESWAGIANPPWPSLSDVVAHLEVLWSPVAVIVVLVIVLIIFAVLRYPRPGSAAPAGQTLFGRRTRIGADIEYVSVVTYFVIALAATAVGSILAATLSSDMYVLGYVIYGLFALFFLVVPNVIAYYFALDIPFPTLGKTVANLEHRWHLATAVIVAGLVVLMFHLAFTPWPDIFGPAAGAR